MAKRKQLAPSTPLERVMLLIKRLTPDERIGVIKVLAGQLAGVRLYTEQEIEHMLDRAVSVGAVKPTIFRVK